MATFGYDAVYHADSSPDATLGLSGARGEDHAGAVGGTAGALHAVV